MAFFIKKYYKQVITIFIFFILIIVMINKSFDTTGLIKAKSTELKQLHLDHVLAEEFLTSIYEFEKISKYISEEKEKLNVLLPNNDDEKINLFSQLEKIANDTGNQITLEVIKEDVAEKTTASKTKANVAKESTEKTSIEPLVKNNIKLNISLTGNQNDLIEFLQRMETMKYFNDVLSISINKTVATVNINDEDVEYVKGELVKTNMVTVFYLEDKQ